MSGPRLLSCLRQRLSRFRNDKRRPDQEQVASSDKDVKSKKCQVQRVQRNHGVNGHASQGVRGRSYRLSLVFTCFSLSRNFRHPACPDSTCMADMVAAGKLAPLEV